MANRITALKAHFRNPGLLRIFVNDAHAFTVKLIDAADLKTGLTLSDDRMALLRQKHELEDAYLKAIHFLGYRPRSRREIERNLRKKNVSAEITALTIRRLSKSQLIDDEAFANWWVAHRRRLKPRSSYALRLELLQKGIDEGIITAAVADTDDSQAAIELLKAKRKMWRRLDERQKRQKMLAFLNRHGFRYEIAKTACEDFVRQEKDPPENGYPQ